MPNSPYLDILIFAVVAGVILFRLYSVLGRRTGNERPPQDSYRLPGNTSTEPPSNVTALPGRKPTQISAPASDPVGRGLMDIQLADRSFETEHFLSGAKGAYEMIVTAFAAGDRATLQPLLSREVYAAFDSVMRGREERGEKVDFTFVGFKDVKIVEATLKDRIAEITLAFGTEFISAHTSRDGQLVEGDPKVVRTVTDVWTFSRDTRSRDPNWSLIATSGDLP
jgi:predicted lipid-binding transport protein (Tim44 family)